ncbi:DUF4262 domain-containing protein [Pseudonocardia oroxyli]|uniref:DUF4262 domain-containing protein n=1 Tax=Pseudonocardia oroxyli TaxID=366584 RepID=A0A1G7S3L0_PSEOR|nr:DUF4262 domain-containing protein [Pseudonocardia oroxyli]SDG17578.1 protein of unknown function [Pseudonocardia oroxyli]
MCAMCASESYEQVVADLAETVREHGWAVRVVYGTGRRPPWAYTVGLGSSGLPELVVTGLPAERAVDLLNDVAEHVLDAGVAPRPGERAAAALEYVEVAEPDAHLVHAVALYGEGRRAVQVVWADEAGRWPWDPAAGGVQPVLGPRSPDAPPLT